MTENVELLLSADCAQLPGLAHEDARALLGRTLDAFERQELKFDHLPLFGAGLAARGRRELECAVLEWAAATPCAARLDIVSYLLVGLWRRRPPTTIDAFVRLHDRVAPGEDVEYGYLLALAEAAALPAARPILEAALGKRLSNADVDAILRTRLERALALAP